MSVIAELTLPDPIFFGPTFDAVPTAELTFEDVHYVQVGSDSVRYVLFLWADRCEFDEFEAAVRADQTLEECSSIVEFDDRALYRVVTPARYASEDPLVYPLFRDYDVTTLESRRTASGLHLQVRFPDRDTLRAFQRALADRGATVEIARLLPEDGSADEACDLTEKQRDAITLAVDRGYFETPKAVTLSELAEEFGVTPQTLSRHLRVAVETIVEQATESMQPGDSPVEAPKGTSG